LLDTRNRDGNVTEFVSPMIDLKSKLINRGNVELFSYTSPVPRYLQLSALAKFDGRQWTALAEDLVAADGTLAEAPANSEPFTQNIAIKKLGGKLAPGSATAITVTWQGDQGFRWAAGAAALFVDGGVKPGIVYQVNAATNDPSQDQLRGATVGNAPDPVYYEVPNSLPQEVRDLAAQNTQDATTPYDKVIALQNWFRTAFEYSTVVQRGHSNDAMIDFLTIRKGYCEQFSGTFAAMARTLNIPARVVVGFTPGNLGADGQYHVAGRHAHAWDEVWFDGLGWVLFDPTPGRGAPGAEQHTGVAAAQDTSNGTPGGTGTDNGAPTPTVSLPSVNPNRPIGERPSAPVTPRNPVARKQASNNSSGGWIIAALLLAVAAWVVAMPRVLRRWSRRHTPDPSTRVAAAWAATVRSLSMAGAPRMAGATPLEYARSIDFGRAESVEIARLVTRAVYSPSGVDSGAADRSELLRSEVDAVCRSRMGVVARMLDQLDPRSAWHRIAG
jgi:transglutaminase-like putative cysteine protease